ncbi:MAG TPA: SRPBCC family protein [Blastocatellia bacterium]|nr:SRPBCC family protein [Blastocatellia bacterium]
MLHQLRHSSSLPITLSEAWDFFSNPANLTLLTPPELKMQILTPVSRPMYAGQIITHQVRPLFNIPILWVTEITQVREPHYFVDEQRYGPYRMWHHQHFFREVSGGVVAEDLVDYMMPAGPLGSVIRQLLVSRQLEKIFEYRAQALRQRFGSLDPGP